MRKILLGIIIIFLVFVISGCVSDSKRQDIIRSLKRNDIIKSNWKLIDKVKGISNKETKTFMYLYIYKDKNDKMYGVEVIPSSIDKDGTTKYNANVYEDVNKDESNSIVYNKDEAKNAEKIYKYSSDKKTRDTMIYKLNSNNKKKYNISYTKGMIFNKYQVVEDN